MNRFWILMAVLGLTACSSPAPFNYTLSPPVATTTETMAGATQIGPYSLSAVTVPEEVDQASLVVQQNDGRLLILSHDRWTAPLSSHLQTALSLELTTRLGMPPVQNLLGGAVDPRVTRIQVDVQRFDLLPGQSVSINALWRIRFAGSEQSLTCFVKLQQPVSIGVAALVTGQQKNTQVLSSLIAESLITRKGPPTASCSKL